MAALLAAGCSTGGSTGAGQTGSASFRYVAVTQKGGVDLNAKSALQLGSIPMRGLPATVVIDRQGRVAGVFLGAVLAGDLEPVLRTLVDEP